VPGSGWENKLGRALERDGLPKLIRQHVVRDERGVFVARVDLAYPDKRLYIEFDGSQHADPRQRKTDLDRQNRLSALGWRPLRFIDTDLRTLTAISSKVRAARRFS
jgi:very-short-patch-repair endonuclease